MRRAILLLPLLALAACTSASIDDAYGVPDALAWSYFDAPPDRVVGALQRVLPGFGYQIETVADLSGGGFALDVTTLTPSAELTEIYVLPTDAEGYQARVQTTPPGRKLNTDLEGAVRAEL